MMELSLDQKLRLEALKILAEAGRISAMKLALEDADILVEYIRHGRRRNSLAGPARARL